MSRIISKLFSDSSASEKDLPQGFAEQILQHDINFVLSNFTNLDALNHLVQLYMKGVEYYESLQDRKQEYFKYKLHWLMSHPNLLQEKSKKVEMHYPSIQEKLLQKIEPDGKNQVQQLITNIQQDKQNHLKLQKLISNEINDQQQRINNRLRQRSTSKNERDIKQQPQTYHNHIYQNQIHSLQQPQIQEAKPEDEQSYVISKNISPHK
ncbi:unnamed protein product [Paramecium octaurelia]|uniref:Uncharacterized protein n=1 Tax=Paramecium octaurelia TaxID=43137 RepID=A0A8S1VAC0_PAROT|nr:unnamed protein product [Paramecium octaurelia]